MIDTIVLTLPQECFHITYPDAFTPSAHWALSATPPLQSLYAQQNPTKKDLRAGIYKPRLTLAHRINNLGGRHTTLRIELSLPKLFFGNNFMELRYKDFPVLAQALVAKLHQMGVATTIESITRAPVSVIHYAKNIALTDGSTPYHYINKIKEANVQLSLDVNETNYRNEGHSYKWHSNSYEVAFYDKIKDLEYAYHSTKRAIEKDTVFQLDLFKKLRTRRKKFEILRMEVRLNKKQKIKRIFSKLGIKAELTFKKLFKPAIAKKILLHYLDEIESKRPPLLDYRPANDKALLVDLVMYNPDLNTRQIFSLYGLKQATMTMNLRELRKLFARYNARTWYRLMADAYTISLPGTKSPFAVLRDEVKKFRAIRGIRVKQSLCFPL